MKHKILLLAIPFVLSSCMKLKKKGDEPAAPSAATEIVQQQATQKEKFDYEYVYEPGQSVQKVLFTFPNHWPDQIVMVETNVNDENVHRQEAFDISKTRSVSVLLLPEIKVNFKFFKVVVGKLEPLEEVEVLPVLNLDLDTDLNLFKTYSLNSKTKKIFISSLRLRASSHLFLESFSGVIQIESIESEGGVIRTFPSDQRAADGVDGRSGGSVTFAINQGSGELHLEMVGEKGGDGKKPLPPGEDKRGAPGADGRQSFYVPDMSIYGPRLQTCASPGTVGLPGDHGIQGDSGNDGMNGGNSGQAAVYLRAGNISVYSTNKGGAKGLAGAPGQGGPGGFGGKGGSYSDTSLVCGSFANGAQGDPGILGALGHDGEEGRAGKNRLFINGQKADFANEN